MVEFALFCPQKGYLDYIDEKQNYPYVSSNRDKAKIFRSEEDAEKFKKHSDYLHWFRVKRL